MSQLNFLFIYKTCQANGHSVNHIPVGQILSLVGRTGIEILHSFHNSHTAKEMTYQTLKFEQNSL